MRRSAKYGLYGVVLLGLVGGSLAWFGAQKNVTILVEGQRHHVRTMAATVGGALRDAKLQVGGHDVVAPAARAALHRGTVVQLRRGRLLELSIDGVQREVWTTDTTVAQALADLGYGQGRMTGVSRAARLPLTPTQISLVMPKQITVVADGRRRHVQTTALSVGEALGDLNLNVTGYDKVSVPLSTAPSAGLVVVVKRVTLTVRTLKVAVPYRTVSKQDASAYRGTTKVVKAGRAGSMRVTYQYVYLDGKLVGRTEVWTGATVKPTTQVQKVGTRSRPSSGGGSGGGAGPTPVGEAQAIGKKLVTARGWNGTQFGCLVNLWNRESHWNVHAGNPVSGAYGIPQALPGSKMASAGPNWQDDATTQETWGLNYIAGRYGTPCGAWAHSQATGWY